MKTSQSITGAASSSRVPRETPVAPWTTFRRVSMALALPLAFVFQAITNSCYAYVQSLGYSDETGAETIRLFGEYPRLATTMSLVSMVGSALVVPGVLAALRVLRKGRPRLSLLAGVLMIAGYMCYFAVVMSNFDQIELARLAPEVGAELIDSSTKLTTLLPIFLIFVIGNLLGTLLLGIAVFLSGAVARWAGILIAGWTVGHITNLVVGSECFAVAGGILEVVGLSVVALAALRMSNEEWVRRG